jgi:hypothetical protein
MSLNKLKAIYIPAIIALLFGGNLYAQSCCGRVALPAGGVDQRPLLKGQTDFRITYENSLLDRTLLGSNDIDDPLNRWNRTQVAAMAFSYGFNDRFTGALVIPVKWSKLSLVDDRVNRKTSGIGDIAGLVKFRVLAPISPREPEIAIGAGIKIPTGSYKDDDYFGTLSASQQVGSGAFDLISALYYNQLLVPVLVQSNAVFRYPTKNDRGYQFGSDLELRGKVLYPDLVERLSPWLGFRSRFAGRDSYDGSPLDSYGGGAYRDSGGKWYYVSSGLEIRLARNFNVSGEFDIPVYSDVNGRQITESFIWRVSTAFSGLF